MDKEQYLVSICIPTYNRAPYLKQCLDSLVCQPEFLRGDVEIVVSDNASTDGTKELIQKYQNIYKNITYHRNAISMSHINGDYNYAIALKSGHGLLRKLGGDSRIYHSGSLAYFCTAAKKYQNKKPIMYFSNGHNALQIEDEHRFTNLDDFLLGASYGITWQDTFFLWASECETIDEYAIQSDSGWWFIEKNMELFKEKKEAVFFSRNVISVSKIDPKDVSYGLFKMFYKNYLGIFRKLQDNKEIKRSTLNFLEEDILLHFFPTFVALWEINSRHWIFSESEDLKNLVFLQCNDKPYFYKMKKAYIKEKIKIKRKEYIDAFWSKILWWKN